ncbi:MAG: glycosyl transferase family 1 [Candidatus Omnitrophica bacterium CG1_02_49_10]|nr:MAG: glycosyl transferase family 1 [Candidatus Omnitrophica bacterium CG1_02_49_10]
MANLDAYAKVVGESIIGDLKLLAEKLKGKIIQNVNSTAMGGGVAEILSRMIPLLKELGVDARWDVIEGSDAFFDVTKKFHNALHGRHADLAKEDFRIFDEVSRKNIERFDTYGDIMFIHDPQPIELIKKKAKNKWIWRCHIDASNPDMRVWKLLRSHIVKYDAAVFSAPSFSRQLPIKQYLITPSIDPLSDKNKDLTKEEVDVVFRKSGIPMDKPIITQVSRFDYIKDQIGVIEAYKQVKRYNDCRLVLVGGPAKDDPESGKVLDEVRTKADGDPDIHILLLPPDSHEEINALQRGSTIIVQKSLKEGFGLTVAEAMWKAKPVVASAVGGITLQIKHKYSGLLCHSVEGAAFEIKQLLNSPEYAKRLGENGREHVRSNFLLTRHLRNYMLLFLSLFHKDGVIYL